MLRCTTCTKFSVRIGRAMCSDEQAPLIKAQGEHLNQVLGHRALCTRLNQLSEASVLPGADLTKGVLKLDIDGADQAKAMIPRGVHWAKSLSTLWRPQSHIVGVLIHGASCHIGV